MVKVEINIWHNNTQTGEQLHIKWRLEMPEVPTPHLNSIGDLGFEFQSSGYDPETKTYFVRGKGFGVEDQTVWKELVRLSSNLKHDW